MLQRASRVASSGSAIAADMLKQQLGPSSLRPSSAFVGCIGAWQVKLTSQRPAAHSGAAKGTTSNAMRIAVAMGCVRFMIHLSRDGEREYIRSVWRAGCTSVEMDAIVFPLRAVEPDSVDGRNG